MEGYAGPTPKVVKGLAEHARGVLGSTWTVSESVSSVNSPLFCYFRMRMSVS